MASDAHAHPFYLARFFKDCEAQRLELKIPCAASAWSAEEFIFNESLAAKSALNREASMALCFGVHPQLPLIQKMESSPDLAPESFNFLQTLVSEKRIKAVGECGVDFFNAAFRSTETEQEELFTKQLDLAVENDLPVVLHIRRSIDSVFKKTALLKKIKAVVFHSYCGTEKEAFSLLKRGINCYFSFSNSILRGNKKARAACAVVPQARVLFETDAPYQSLKGAGYSTYSDLRGVLKEASILRGESEDALEKETDKNFWEVFLL
ncbi:MAG: TatD family hydrolase [Spirochaetaceae bacterium]|nr:TatD family hydrolase [Spirochaetaceae bacterium]